MDRPATMARGVLRAGHPLGAHLVGAGAAEREGHVRGIFLVVVLEVELVAGLEREAVEIAGDARGGALVLADVLGAGCPPRGRLVALTSLELVAGAEVGIDAIGAARALGAVRVGALGVAGVVRRRLELGLLRVGEIFGGSAHIPFPFGAPFAIPFGAHGDDAGEHQRQKERRVTSDADHPFGSCGGASRLATRVAGCGAFGRTGGRVERTHVFPKETSTF